MQNASSRLLRLGALVALLAGVAPAQDGLRFDHLTMEEGLSESIVLSIAQDSAGFLWFGTADGLNRYDGTTVRTFHADPSDSGTISHDYVQGLLVDRSGRLWVASLGGLDLYDPGHESFRRIPLVPGRTSISVSGLSLAPRGEALWLATGAGILEYAPGSGAVRRHPADTARSDLRGPDITCLAFDAAGLLWTGSRVDGVTILDPSTDATRAPARPAGAGHGEFVTAIRADRSGTVWIATDGGGLERLDPRTGDARRYLHADTDPGSLGADVVRAIFEDREGTLWIATDGGGLDRYDRASGGFLHLRHDGTRASSIANDRVSALFEDRAGTLWAGTWGSGVDRWSPSKEKFRLPARFAPLSRALPNRFVVALFEDSRGIVWAGTHGGGAVGIAPSTGTLYPLLPAPGALTDGTVWSIREDRDGDLWFATERGVDRLEWATHRWTHFGERDGERPGLGSRFAARVEPAGDYVWVTTNKGLDRIDRRTDSIRNFPYSLAGRPQGSALALVRDGDLLVLGTTPIAAFDTRTLQFVPSPVNLENVSVSCFVPDRAGNLWVGTFGQGAYLLDGHRALLRHLDTQSGLPNNAVFGVLQDAGGRSWMSTNKGLAVFDPGTGAVMSYDAGDGLQDNEFNRGAFWRGRDGTLFFGGVNGFNAFHPDSIRANAYRPPVVFTGFQTFDRPMHLPLAPSAVREIALGPSENYFSFSFAALDYTEPRKNEYAYMLEGFDGDWIHCGTRAFGGYTNLDPGTYVLRVKGANSDGVWNEEGTSVRITIAPPWWRTTWAYVLYVLLVLGGGAGIRWLAQNWSIILASRKARYVAHYRLHELIGEGGMGKVYRASDLRTKEIVALKLLAPELLQDTENRRRLATEGRLLATFRHPHIVQVLEVGETAERSFIAMEYLPGGTLQRRLRTAFPLPPAEVRRLALQIVDGLAEIHARGVVHRDLKTANVMLDAEGNARIMDFGLSKSPLVTTMTTLGTAVGTLGYTAPEQVTGVAVDHRADLFSFGALLYELLTNRLPFSGENEMAMIHALFNTEPRPPSSIQPGFPASFDTVVLRCLVRDPDGRYADVGALLEALESITVGQEERRR